MILDDVFNDSLSLNDSLSNLVSDAFGQGYDDDNVKRIITRLSK